MFHVREKELHSSTSRQTQICLLTIKPTTKAGQNQRRLCSGIVGASYQGHCLPLDPSTGKGCMDMCATCKTCEIWLHFAWIYKHLRCPAVSVRVSVCVYKLCSFTHGLKQEGNVALERQNGKGGRLLSQLSKTRTFSSFFRSVTSAGNKK